MARRRPLERRFARRRASHRACGGRAEEAGEAGSEALHNMRERAGDVADSASEALDNIRERAGDVADSASETLDNIRERAGDAAVSAKQAIGSIRDRAAETYSSAAGRVRDTAASLGRAAPKLRDGVTSAGQSFVDLCREQPVVLAGIGLAVGATIGALLPQTSAENRVIGAASDDVKARVRRVSAKVSDAAQSVYGEAKHAAGTTMAPRRDAAAEESGSVDLGHS